MRISDWSSDVCSSDLLAARPAALGALGHEVVDAANSIFVAGIPVLHRRILDLRVFQRDQLDHRRVQLVLVAHRRGAAFQVGNLGAVFEIGRATSELQSLMRISYDVFCLKKKTIYHITYEHNIYSTMPRRLKDINNNTPPA